MDATPIDQYLKPPFTHAEDTGYTWHGGKVYIAISDKPVFIGPPKYYVEFEGKVIELLGPECYEIMHAINRLENYEDEDE